MQLDAALILLQLINRHIDMTVPPIKPDDVFFLFSKLPYDHVQELPLIVGPNVYLDDTPQQVLEEAHRPLDDDSFCTAFHLLNYYSPLNPVCLRNPAAKVWSSKCNPSDLFFIVITVLCLRKPLGIQAVMQFELGNKDGLIKNGQLFIYNSPYFPDTDACYSSNDVHICKDIVARQIEVSVQKYKKSTSALVLFGQVTCGLSKSFQMSYFALFSALVGFTRVSAEAL